ncbi:oxygenase MpaB family protein [Streptomyces sp. NPDC059766]|uniref:oxygenase MpaB family protein n=1 Tax=Streptomyces sp. NPDC059766 TaxID=3346940 RepID=UPI0036519279
MTDTEARTARGEPDPLTPQTILWDIAGDRRLLLSLPAGFVLQVAHPAVGAGVDAYSVFRTDPWGRLDRSLESLQLWIYGGERAAEEGRRLRRLHRTINGTDTRGRPYHALTPACYAWVHATAYAVFLRAARYLARPLTPEESVRLYDELRQLGRILGINDRDMPENPEAYWAYFDAMVRDELEMTPVARELLDPRRPVPAPPGASAPVRLLWPVLHPPLTRLRVFVTVGLLPPVARDRLGLAWTPRDERLLRGFGAVLRTLFPLLPERVRYLPLGYAARRAAHPDRPRRRPRR